MTNHPPPAPTPKQILEENRRQRAEMDRSLNNPTPSEIAASEAAGLELEALFPSSEPTPRQHLEESRKQAAEMERRVENPTPEEIAESKRAIREAEELFGKSEAGRNGRPLPES